MKIIHVCLASHYTEGMTYQDNLLADQNARDGHDVIVISDCFKYNGHQLVEVDEVDCHLESGIRLVRFKYDNILNKFISSKIRKVRKLKDFIYYEKPDVVLFHGIAGYEMLTVAKYKCDNPHTKLYIDSHEDYNNSGRNWVSRFFQYKIFNRLIVNKVKACVDKFLYVSEECKNFILDIYKLKSSEIEFYPLGGNIVEKNIKDYNSRVVRQEIGFSDDDIIFVHSGKFSKEKRTVELIEAFSQIKTSRIKLVLVGSIPTEMKFELQSLIENDSRIYFLGWKNSDELIKYLCAADLYVQPGSQSATMQNAICCGTPVALYPFESHKPYLNGNGYYIKNKVDFIHVFNEILNDDIVLKKMSMLSYDVAYSLLDYRVLAARLYK